MPKQRSIAKSRLEALLSMATGAAAEPLAGIAGLYGLTQGGSQEAVRMIDKTRGKLTYQPRDPRGQQEIAAALGPIMQKVEAGKSWLGDKAYNASGSPALGAAAYTAPDALLAALGVRPAMAAGRAASGSVGRAVARSQSLPAPAMGSPASQIGAIRAFHGSPHDFDRFSMDHIGTGEGAQAYGHGLYFAGNPDVATAYRHELAARTASDGGDQAGALVNAAMKAANGDPAKALELARKHSQGLPFDAEAIRRLEAGETGGGALYEVELAPDDADLLDWDAPLSEQPEKVRNALIPALQELNTFPDGTPVPASSFDRVLGSAAYHKVGIQREKQLWDDANPPPPQQQLSSDYLRQLGIPGLRYLDGGSRAAGDGSRNYVMFDDSLIKILGKK